MIEDKKVVKSASRATKQNILMENREKITVSGIVDVESFDDQNVVLHTDLGILLVKGEDLHINKINIESGELIVEGYIISCSYTDVDSSSKGLGFFGKLFR